MKKLMTALIMLLAACSSEKADIFKSAYHRQHTEKTGECFPVEIIQIRFVGRDDIRGDERGGNGYAKHDVFS